jgi:hypothetical protein
MKSPPETENGGPGKTPVYSAIEFLGNRDLSLLPAAVKSLDEQIADNTAFMLAMLGVVFPDRIEMERLKRSIIARHMVGNRKRP